MEWDVVQQRSIRLARVAGFMTGRRGLWIAASAGALGLVLLAGSRLPAADWAVAIASRIRGAGASGVLLFTAAYVLATVALLPGSLLTLVAGFAYGPVGGLLVTSPASVLAATVAFLLGRTAFRGRVQRRLAGSPRARALNRAIGRDSFKLILLLRLSPVVPFNLLNYALGASEASVGRYVAASFIGMLPGTWMYVYLGSLATTAAALTDAGRGGGAGRIALSVGGLVATVAAVAIVTRSARGALERELNAEGP
jgi:uncharacterized membrane protein YdjX (TVP38/TMEM64 family)